MKKTRGFSMYLVFIIMLIFVVYLTRGLNESQYIKYSFQAFEAALEKKTVQSVTLIPSEEVPTGLVRLTLIDGQKGKFNGSDITEVEKLVRNAGIPYTMEEVEKPGWFFTSVMPYIILIIFMIVFMFILTGQGASSSGGNKVMNFGRSRARMTMGKDNKFTFKDVAG